MRTFRLSVCKGVTCRQGGADAVHQAACEEVDRQELTARCLVRRGGCWGMCHLGPNVVIRENVGRPQDPFHREDYQLMGWEEEVLYGAMSPAKLQRIVREHIEGGEPVAEWVTPPGDAVTVSK
jgi:(2Fe-2S) ferredoxin